MNRKPIGLAALLAAFLATLITALPAIAQPPQRGDRSDMQRRRHRDQQQRGQRGQRGQHRLDTNALIVGEMAPGFVLNSLDGESSTSLAAFRGKRPVVLIFGSYT